MKLNQHPIYNHYINGKLSFHQTYTEEELYVLYYITNYTLDKYTAYNVVNLSVSDVIESVKETLRCILKCYGAKTFDINLHGMIEDQRKTMQYVFFVNEKYICNDALINFCNESQNYYSVYGNYKIFYGKFYVMLNLANSEELLGELLFAWTKTAKYSHKTYGIDIENISDYIYMDINIQLYEFDHHVDDTDKVTKLVKSNSNLFQKLYKNHKCKTHEINA